MTTANNFELNFGDQMIVAFDVSGSMQANDCPGNSTRFKYVQETMRTFIKEAAKYDPDGVSFYAFNNTLKIFPDVKTVEEIDNMIAQLRPGGGTSTELPITAAYKEHKDKGSEQTFLLLFTDGEPGNKQAVEQAIIDITNDVADEKEFRIAILTIGVRDSALEQWLSDLDDNLGSKGAKYDIVAIHKLEDVDFEQAIADAISGSAN
jgi:Mg-chelatase subunit ChlD